MIDNNTTDPGPSPAEEGAPAKSKAIAPLSFRPKEGPMHDFMQELIRQFGKAQKAIEHCVTIAMDKPSEGTEPELRRIIATLEAELLKLNASGVPVQELQLSPDQEAFIQKIIAKKKTDRDNAIKFCILYTKENKLWF